MSEASFLPEAEEESSENSPSPKAKDSRLTKLEALRAQLREAIEREDYERAAQLRDDIRKIE
jgi:protein-arginine kinase activator protein McsA